MKTITFIGAALAVAAFAMPLHAKSAGTPGEKLIACYDKVLVPAQYSVEHKLLKPAERKYVKKNGRIELWEYAAVYQEVKTLLKDEYYVMKEIPCK